MSHRFPSLPAEFEARMRRLCGDDFADFYSAPTHRGLRVHTNADTETVTAHLPFALTPAPFAKNGFYVNGDDKVGAHPLHHAGALYMQEPSAQSAVTALAVKAGERVLDTCAAPGGKSTQIAEALGSTGLLWCNEYVRPRAKILCQNLERMGAKNRVVTSVDVAQLGRALPAFFDAVLCDVPCSGEGMFRKEPEAIPAWSLDNIKLCAARGAHILDEAAKTVKPGGRLLLSTCTFAPEENECQAAAFLRRHPEFSLVPLTVPFGRPAFSWNAVASFADTDAPCPADLTGCRRIFPADGGEGHFLALFRKISGDEPPPKPLAVKPQPAVSAALAAWFNPVPDGHFVLYGDVWHLLPLTMPNTGSLLLLQAGIPAAVAKKGRLEPTHTLFAAYGKTATQRLDLPADSPAIAAFLKGEPLSVDAALKGYVAVLCDGVPLGFGKASGGTLKNHYPKGLRNL